MIARPTVSVIVPHYNDLERLNICLDALGGQTFPVDRFEIIVADNDSCNVRDSNRSADRSW